jgi:NADPH-dependent 2,4-dienoyl-CoA reductase/sulfur reductase-like enzyme
MVRRVVIVGAGLAGSRCAQTLRAEGFDGAIALVGDEQGLPYERPALSKEFLAGTRSDLALQPARFWSDREIMLLTGMRVDRIDPVGKLARTRAGDFCFDALVIATGARARRLPGLAGPGIHVLRTLDDARRLRPKLVAGRRLTIVGAGFVGTEVASTAVGLGLEVTIVDAARLPFEHTLGSEIGRVLAARYRTCGVDLRLGTRVAAIRRDGRGAVRALALADGSELQTDLVLVAVGAEPADELTRGLVGAAAGGIPTDAAGRTGIPSVYACGDVAAPWHPALSRTLRLEHWTSASSRAAAVAHAIVGREEQSVPAPYFWSDQFGFRLQHVGLPEGWTHVVLEGDEESLEARYLDADERLVGALLVNRPAQVAPLRRQITTELVAA